MTTLAITLQHAKEIARELVAAELSLFCSRETILRKAWALGESLSQLKEAIGHGRWLIWLPSNFKELGKNDERRIKNAQRCMNFFRDNPNSRNSANFDIDSVRKLMWGYIPAKERLSLDGDGKDNPAPHHLTFVNHFAKWDRQVAAGHAEMPPLDLFRREIEKPLRRIIELAGREWVMELLAE